MAKREKNPNKEIEKAIYYAKSNGWRCKEAGNSSHAWGRLLCPEFTREGCSVSVWSTPKDADNHKKQIYRRVDMCPHFRKI
jgi:hypothetical protein